MSHVELVPALAVGPELVRNNSYKDPAAGRDQLVLAPLVVCRECHTKSFVGEVLWLDHRNTKCPVKAVHPLVVVMQPGYHLRGVAPTEQAKAQPFGNDVVF